MKSDLTKDNILLIAYKYLRILATAFGVNHICWTISTFVGYSLYDLFKGVDYALLIGVLLCSIVIVIISFCLENGWQRVTSLFVDFFCKEQMLFALFCLVVFVSALLLTIIDDNNYLKDNIHNFYEIGISSFVFFPLGRYYSRHKLENVLKMIFHTFMLVITIFDGWVLFSAFRLEIYDWGFGYCLGLDSNYQLCINRNPNITGMVTALVALICIWNLIYHKGIIRWLYSVALVIHFCVMTLTNSRASFIGFTLGAILMLVSVMYRLFNYKYIRLRIFISTLVGLCAGFAIFFSRIEFLKLFDLVTKYSSIIGREAGNAAKAMDPTYLSGRGEIWKHSIRWLIDCPRNFLLGTTPDGVAETLRWVEDGVQYAYDHTHNEFLEVAVATGVPGLIVYVLWLFSIAKDSIFLVINNIRKESYRLIIPSCLIAALVVINLVEARLLFNLLFNCSVFAILCGCVTGYSQNNKT